MTDAATGGIVRARTGGNAFIRNLIETLEVLYAFSDIPDVVHDIMQSLVRVFDRSSCTSIPTAG